MGYAQINYRGMLICGKLLILTQFAGIFTTPSIYAVACVFTVRSNKAHIGLQRFSFERGWVKQNHFVIPDVKLPALRVATFNR